MIFLPVAFMKGIIGRFFLQFALTVVFAVLVSMLVSFTLTPMMASIFLKGNRLRRGDSGVPAKSTVFSGMGKLFDRGYKVVEGLYRRLLEVSLRHRKTVLILALLIFILSLYITKFIGKEFVPPEDQGRFIGRLEGPVDYSIDQMDSLFRKAEDIFIKTPEVTTVFYALGFGFPPEINKAVLFTGLTPKSEREKSQEEIKAEMRKKLNQIPGIKATAEDIALIGGGQRTVPIQYSIRGRDLGSLQTYTREIVREFSKLPGIVDVDTSLEAGKPELRVYIDRDKAADLGVDVATVAGAINLLIGGELDITKFKDESKGKRYDVRVQVGPGDRKDPHDLGRRYVRSRDGKMVELAIVVRVQEGGGPSIITRVDRQRAIT
ncbi:MAG: efflux RND transporter permease subunit, partial [Syntrophales bacterium]|nr:efflux RND transporter permease subunit [Syntrophales bacterium]